MTVRQVFYRLTVDRIVEKDECGYRAVQRQVLNMRREGLSWEFIADGTRWRHAPEVWDSAEDALRETARTSRPAKEKGEPDAVELNAIPPDKLNALVDNAIIANIDEDAWNEADEREKFLQLVGAGA